MTTDLVLSTRDRLHKFKGRYREICARTGLGYSWLSKFSNGHRGVRPSFEHLQRLLGALDVLEREDKARRQVTG